MTRTDIATTGRPGRVAARAGALVLLAALATPAFAANQSITGQKKEEFQTAAPYAILIEADSGSVLFEKNADQPTPPSSLAKLMTAEVVFNELAQGHLKLEDEFQVTEDAWRRGGAPSHTSSMFAPIYSKVKVDDLLHGVIIQSANDACITLATGLSGNETAFAIQMNRRAREIGLTSSTFTNSTGLPSPGLRASVRDLGKLARHIIRTYPQYYGLYGEKEFTWNKIRQQNRNPLLASVVGADGMKTGYTQDGGYGLVGSAMQNGLRLIVVINGLKTEKERADEGKRLLEWGFRAFEQRVLFAEGQTVGEARVFGGAQRYVPLVGSRTITLMVPRGSTERIAARIVYTGPVQAPVERGQSIGLLRVQRGDNVALEAPLTAGDSVGRGGMVGRAVDAAGELVVGLFRSGRTAVASSGTAPGAAQQPGARPAPDTDSVVRTVDPAETVRANPTRPTDSVVRTVDPEPAPANPTRPTDSVVKTVDPEPSRTASPAPGNDPAVRTVD